MEKSSEFKSEQDSSTLQPLATSLAQYIIVLAVPVVLVMLPIRILLQPWIIYFEYSRPGFPPDMYGMSQAERQRLALDGLESIAGPRAMEALRQARFDDGQIAFTEREISHMLDVRLVAAQLFRVQIIAGLGLAVAALALYRQPRTRPHLTRALGSGALLTLLSVVGAGLFGLVAWNNFFTAFHRVFFSGDSWLFAYTDTLIRLYPVRFWIDITAFICGAIVLEALILGAAAWWWKQRYPR